MLHIFPHNTKRQVKQISLISIYICDGNLPLVNVFVFVSVEHPTNPCRAVYYSFISSHACVWNHIHICICWIGNKSKQSHSVFLLPPALSKLVFKSWFIFVCVCICICICFYLYLLNREQIQAEPLSIPVASRYIRTCIWILIYICLCLYLYLFLFVFVE